MGINKYNLEQKKWLDENWKAGISNQEITRLFNENFGTSYNHNQMKGLHSRDISVYERIENNELFTNRLRKVGNEVVEERAIDIEKWKDLEKDETKILEFWGYPTDGTWSIVETRQYINGTQAMVYVKARPIFPENLEVEKLKKVVQDFVQPIKIKPVYKSKKELNTLVIPMFDLHIGNTPKKDLEAVYDFYADKISKCTGHCIIVLGGDLLDVDNLQYTTTHGTQLEKGDLNRAWKTAYEFIIGLYSLYDDIEFVYTNGNHDDTSGATVVWAVEKAISKEIDTSNGIKVKVLEDGNAIVIDHGYNNIKDYTEFLLREHGKELAPVISKGGRVDVFIGHLHFEEVKHNWATIWRIPSPTIGSEWSKGKGLSAIRGVRAINFDGKEITRFGIDL